MTAILILAFFAVPSAYAQHGGKPYTHHQMAPVQNMQKWLQEGYTKKEVYHAAFIAEHSGKKMEAVLQYYKKHKSWKETATHFGVDVGKIRAEHHEAKEHFYAANKENIIRYLAQYNGRSRADIEKYARREEDRHFLILASALAKLGHKNLDTVMKMHRSGNDPQEIIESLKVDRHALFKEVRSIHEAIQGTSTRPPN
ncbi:hypothetical protein [Weizmannia acidilactici]|uniref:hypothetical protein n=1 Tax=Weizmannia acidilactici TaxID=2607726 RepID=UPI00124DFF4D|nr:hypothetical protein [Weizmannia acidilactici]